MDSDALTAPSDGDLALRHAAFAWLDLELAKGNYEFSRAMLASFEYEGRRMPLTDVGSGIRTPAGFSAVLSLVSSTDSRTGHYGDQVDEASGTVLYAYQQEKAPRNRTANQSVRAAIDSVPIIYFQGVRDGWFVPHYPAYVVADDPVAKEFTIALDEELKMFGDPFEFNELQRKYASRIVRQRLHQRPFRARVLRAYEDACTVCRFRHRELLDAAHIIRDSASGGLPRTSNGLALCRLHHGAYDGNLMGITADGQVRVKESLLHEVDGPMLRHGLQLMHGQFISMPRIRSDRPDQDALATRFQEFERAR